MSPETWLFFQYILTIIFSFLDDVLNILIVHRPGCEYLDDVADQLSSLLRSNGLGVDTAFGTDDLSAEGGIASYLQRHIQACDYVIVFVTPMNSGNNSCSHILFMLLMLILFILNNMEANGGHISQL